ncbi:MAG: hypothetical protein QGG42_05020 [Phycisphaerae bacterium]|jgi:hypothetical protein|nr:hypothetical protein [Phycisphaerae bacterium]
MTHFVAGEKMIKEKTTSKPKAKVKSEARRTKASARAKSARGMPADDGMAFIVVIHPGPAHISALRWDNGSRKHGEFADDHHHRLGAAA